MTIHVDLSSSDPKVESLLRQVEALPMGSSARSECEGALYLALARVCWRDADRCRELERHRAARDARRGEA